MLALPLLAAAALAQAPPPPGPPGFVVGERVLARGSAMAEDRRWLFELADLVATGRKSPKQARARYAQMRAAGLVVEVPEGTPLEVRGEATDPRFVDPATGRPAPVYLVGVLAGPDRMVSRWAYGDQLRRPGEGRVADDATAEPDGRRDRRGEAAPGGQGGAASPTEPDGPTPGPAETPQVAAARRAEEARLLDRDRRIYCEAARRRALAEGLARAATPDRRDQVLRDETAAWRRELARQHYLPVEDLEAIVAEGDRRVAAEAAAQKDRTADRREAKRATEAGLGVVDRVVGASIAASVRSYNAGLAAQYAAARAAVTPRALDVPLDAARYVPGSGYSTWVPAPVQVRSR